jgi:hypothetical protein
MNSRFLLTALGSVAALFSTLSSTTARANPRPLTFTYQSEQLAKGEAELEQFGDYTPVRARSAESGDLRWYGLSQFQTEFEYGVTDRSELGLYVSYVPSSAPGFSEIPRSTEGTGLKQRLRYQLAPPGVWPVDVSVYGEIVETEREIEFEGKLVLQRRFGKLRAIGNFTAEREYYFDGVHDIVIIPTAGLTFEATPVVQPGFEYWMRAEYPEEESPSPRPFQLGPHHYLGPTLLLQLGRLWWTTGLYTRLSDRSHSLTLGEGFGSVWLRTVVGLAP